MLTEGTFPAGGKRELKAFPVSGTKWSSLLWPKRSEILQKKGVLFGGERAKTLENTKAKTFGPFALHPTTCACLAEWAKEGLYFKAWKVNPGSTLPIKTSTHTY